MNTSEIDPAIKAYRDAYEKQRQAADAATEQQKANDFQTLMSRANRAGVLYSNFPERSKIQYQANTYLPSLQANYVTYQTGMDKLRENIIKYSNQIKTLDKAIEDLNKGSIISLNAY